MTIFHIVLLLGIVLFDVMAARYAISYSSGQLSSTLLMVLILVGFLGALVWVGSASYVAELFQPSVPVYSPDGFIYL